MPTNYETSASSSTILGPTLENNSEQIAKKLATRFQMQIFISYNLEDVHVGLVETKLVQLIQEILTPARSEMVN
jgi:Proteasome assembly chaperone 4